MRTKTLLLTAALAAAGVISSQADTMSVNAVGYVNQNPLPVNVNSGFSIIANPFESIAADYSLNTIIPPGNAALQDASLYRFENGHFSSPSVYDQTDGWDCAANCDLPLGKGAFLLTLRQATITYVGQVKESPNRDLSQPVQTPFVAGFQILASQIPQAGTLNDLQLFGSLTPGDPNDPLQDASIYVFDAATQHYLSPATYDATDKWDPPLNVGYGQGFWLLALRPGTIKRSFAVQ